jgi:broad specificity phosphatase PhoE
MGDKIIYFVRHGETVLNAQNIRQGADGALTESGRAQALSTAKRFPKERGRPEVIIASPFERTKETAEIIGRELSMPVEYSDLLVERRNPSEVIGKWAEDPEVKRIMDHIDKSYHEDDLRVSDEENFADLKERAKNLLHYISGRKEKKIIMVTHGIFLKVVIAYIIHGEHLSAIEHAHLAHGNKMDNAGMTIIKYIPHWFKKAEWKLITWNDLAV